MINQKINHKSMIYLDLSLIYLRFIRCEFRSSIPREWNVMTFVVLLVCIPHSLKKKMEMGAWSNNDENGILFRDNVVNAIPQTQSINSGIYHHNMYNFEHE